MVGANDPEMGKTRIRKRPIWISVGWAHAVGIIFFMCITIAVQIAGLTLVLTTVKRNLSALARAADAELVTEQFKRLDSRIDYLHLRTSDVISRAEKTCESIKDKP